MCRIASKTRRISVFRGRPIFPCPGIIGEMIFHSPPVKSFLPVAVKTAILRPGGLGPSHDNLHIWCVIPMEYHGLAPSATLGTSSKAGRITHGITPPTPNRHTARIPPTAPNRPAGMI